MKYYSQTYLDGYYTLDGYLEEVETVKESECNYFILKEMKKYIFHPGSLFLYIESLGKNFKLSRV
jgi:hypothetical protein